MPRKPSGSGRPSHPSQRARRRRVAGERLVREARILACECDPAAERPVGDDVRQFGFEVVAHHNLADAVREATTSRFDVLVASMPTLDPERLKLMQLLRRAIPSLPVVLVTSDGSIEMRTRCLALRPYYVAVRPLTSEELLTALKGALARG